MRPRRGGAEERPSSASLRGSVTAEFAVALPAVIVLLGFLLSAGTAAVCQIRTEEAARAAARTIARGEGPAAVAEEVARVAGPDARHTVEASAGVVTVRVSAPVPGPIAAAAGLQAHAAASLSSEGVP
ncbi:TadE family type IV pilus minor pilin [Sinomonas sp. ASV486]|uniref:TadE family type IV pilus minor pilin n=1 Tax=Sinomonas puerhi TaxID=3238584 RepID=A0AB39L0Z3_9MICC|nr:TadE family type IV pilus minor pilin [Sinomonas sp. ASV486]MDQ4492100.1 TadE family type IV pilus minor pilin [Sinomonas sp. ASV486]